MKKIIIISILMLLIITSVFAFANQTAESDWWTLEYAEQEEPQTPPSNPTYEPQAGTTWHNASFGASVTVQSTNQSVNMTNPYPANQSTGISINQPTWNITITDPEGDTFSWNITVSNGDTNTSNDDTNGSKFVDLTTPLSYSTVYTIWVNASDTYTFTTEDEIFYTWHSASFGASVEVQAPNLPIVTVNSSSGVEETNATLYGYLESNVSLDTTCWFQGSKESSSFDSLAFNVSVGIKPQGTEFNENITPLENGTLYYFRTRANNTNDWNTSASSLYFLTKPQAPSALTITTISNGFNISWTHGDGYNISYLVFNNISDITERGDGSNIYSSTNNYYHHTGLEDGETYYYGVWEYSNRTTPIVFQWSDDFAISNDTYISQYPKVTNPNPTDTETNVLISQATWNATIEEPSGSLFNWSIETSPNIGTNSSTDDTNGSKVVDLSTPLSYGTLYTVYVNVSKSGDPTNSTNATFTFTTEFENLPPVLSNPVPANQTTTVSDAQSTWSITINDPEGNTFNWSIDISNGDSNSSNTDSNGTKTVDLTTPLAFNTNFYVWVNVTDGEDIVNETFWFRTKHENLTWQRASFGASVEVLGTDPIISNENPTNESTGIDMYPLLNVTVTDPQQPMVNVTWSTNASSWTQTNSSVLSGTTISQRATFANESNTTYWWSVNVSNAGGYYTNQTFHFTTATYTWSDWSDWWVIDYTCCAPTDFTASAFNETVINLTWSACGDGADKNVLVVNETGWSSYPLTPSNGTLLYNGTDNSFDHTDLKNATYYYYTIWGWNETESEFSIINETANARTQGGLESLNPYPANESTEITRPPINISINASGATDVYIYFYNMTPITDTWTLLKHWSGAPEGRFEVTQLSTVNGTTQFIWGNTTYYWTVNITDGSEWINNTYHYTTIELAQTKNSRYDVDNNNYINVFDLSAAWAYRAPEDYDGIYDVDNNDLINVFDLSAIWSFRT